MHRLLARMSELETVATSDLAYDEAVQVSAQSEDVVYVLRKRWGPVHGAGPPSPSGGPLKVSRHSA